MLSVTCIQSHLLSWGPAAARPPDLTWQHQGEHPRGPLSTQNWRSWEDTQETAFVFHIDLERVVPSYKVGSGPLCCGYVSFCFVAVFPFAHPWEGERGRQ